jgi:hypothetical protein
MISAGDLSGRLPDLIDELRDAGYAIGVEQYVAAEDLLLALAARGALADDPARYRTLLGPIFCKSARDQEDFPGRYDRWVARCLPSAGPVVAEPLDDELKDIERGAAAWYWVLAAAALVAAVALSIPHPGGRQDLPVLAHEAGAPGPAPVEAGPPGTSDVGRSEEGPQPQASPSPVDASGRAAAVDRLDEASASPPPPDGPAPGGAQPRHPLWAALVVLVAAFLGWKLWWIHRSRLFLSRRATRESPDLARVPVKWARGELFRHVTVGRVAQKLRHRRQVASDRIDVRATVQSTVRKAGWPTPVSGKTSVNPEYLVLIDRADHHDHQAQFFHELIDRLAADEVTVVRYEFDGDARVCYPPGSPATVATVRELAARHPEHRLLIVSNGSSLISPLTGEPIRWADQFARWPVRALLTPEPIDDWGYPELILAQHGFLVLPATEEGFEALADSLRQESPEPILRPQPSPPFPEVLRDRPRHWLDRREPRPEHLRELLGQLRDYLGEHGYEWLAACAVYPALHWELTLDLGFNLRTGGGLRLLEPKRLAAMARLPWLRHGAMPDWLRLALIRSLPQDRERAIRESLQTLLLRVSQGRAEDLDLEIAHDRRGVLAPLAKQVFRTLRRQSPEDSPLRDFVFAACMNGRRPGPLALELPWALGGPFGARMGRAIPRALQGLRDRVAVVVAAAAPLRWRPGPLAPGLPWAADGPFGGRMGRAVPLALGTLLLLLAVAGGLVLVPRYRALRPTGATEPPGPKDEPELVFIFGDAGRSNTPRDPAFDVGTPSATPRVAGVSQGVSETTSLPGVKVVANVSGLSMLPSTARLGNDLGGGGMIGGDVTYETSDVGVALDQVAREILRHLAQHKLTVVWLFDESESMKDDQKAIRARFDRVASELKVNVEAAARKQAGPAAVPLTHAIVGFGSELHYELEKPTPNVDLIGDAIDHLRIDGTGVENTMHAVQEVVNHYAGLIKKDRHLLIILVTDESGDDGSYVEEARQAVVEHQVPIYVIGRQSLFGYERAHLRYVDPVTKDVYWPAIRRGPETADVEVMQWDGLHNRWDEQASGFAPYELARLAKDSGGIYFLLPSEENMRVRRQERAYSIATLKEYIPEYDSRLEYVERRNRSELRSTLYAIIQETQRSPFRHAYRFPVLPAEMIPLATQAGELATERLKILLAIQARLEGLQKQRDREPTRRWQAHYDLMLAQVVAFQVKTYEYRACLAEMVKALPRPRRMPTVDLTVEWEIHHSPVPQAPGEQTAKKYAEATRLLKLVIERHPATPWADLAQDELSRGLSVQRTEWTHSPKYYEREKLVPRY